MTFRRLLPRPLALLTLFAALATPFPADAKPLKVYVLAGQSNMQGHAHVRTIEVMGLDPETAPLLEKMRGPEGAGSLRVCEEVWISSIGSSEEEKVGRLTAGFGAEQGGPKIGPEFTFGITLHERVGEPILLVKTAWGGKSLHTDFRPPSAGPFEFREEDLERLREQGRDVGQIRAEREAATGVFYRRMIDHVKAVLADPGRVCPAYDPAEGCELAGFVWFQGWNDMVDGGTYPDRGKPGGYDLYSELLGHFIRDVRRDLAAPDLPFVIGVMGAGGPIDRYPPEKQRYADIHREFREAMAAPAELPEFRDNVAAVWTEKYWDMELEALRAEDGKIQEDVKALVEKGEIDRGDAGKAALEARRADAFTERERKILADGASNFEFHYLGSAKILGRIGEAFAEALVELDGGPE